jgi:hypothetical protein
MPELTGEGRRKVEEIAGRHGVSVATAETLLSALAASGGGQAQFSIPELGGMGQWSRGGMVMVGDMFNNGLKARVDALCGELAGLVGSGSFAPQPQRGDASLFVAAPGGDNWWPEGLGAPGSVGAQNDLRYAFFPASRRLVIDQGGRVTVYDTAEHQLSGFSQQQSSDRSLSFTSQHGLVRLADLTVVEGDSAPVAEAAPAEDAASERAPAATAPAMRETAGAEGDIFGKIERLADLHARGILTAAEFEAKKSELLGRL